MYGHLIGEGVVKWKQNILLVVTLFILHIYQKFVAVNILDPGLIAHQLKKTIHLSV